MFKRIIIIFTFLVSCIWLVGCADESVKYISSDADVIDGDNEEQVTEYVSGDEPVESSTYESDADITEEATIPVYVCGAVNSPGVYYISPDSLKADALSMAGGLTEDGAVDYVNLAETVISGEKIYFPYAYEVSDGANINQDNGSQRASEKVNINTATKDELMTLPGIGESKADAIINYREEHGPFQSIEDITNISGIKEGVYNNIKDHIIVN